MKTHAHAPESMLDTAGERAKDYVDKGVDAMNDVADRSRAITRKVDGYVRDNPWYMIAAAAGVGLLVGILIRRR